ncbi:hypothetical protein LMH87_009285 [Akanthomyces muscarius]|uniref:Aminoglycoside N(3)-acetyltransferase n=1 Tax=Akanthomyces muscarius TaxID=2231603 RepID=A0A9W8QB29_AKAMU|nr:hypothetical protein LMH87_009285 [Akanthomyces muscarius]KAJ4152765.1 hypothetical protein LMH87_009285 [Akanthomyces muscarius]
MKTPTKPDTRSLCTRASLATELRLVLCAGDTVLVHSSLSKVGWVCGGAEALVRALLDVVRDSGTLVVPMHTSENSDPTEWCAPPVPESWWPTIRGSMLAFDPAQSRTRQMGVVPETVRGWPGMRRSVHPQTSFAAVGSRAAAITSGHALDSMMGDESPLARLEEVVGAKVMLIGVSWDRCTAFHLAESRLASTPRKANSFAAIVDGNRQWVTVEDMEADSDDFEGLSAVFEAQTGAVTRFMIRAAEIRVFLMSEALEFAEKWLLKHRAK